MYKLSIYLILYCLLASGVIAQESNSRANTSKKGDAVKKTVTPASKKQAADSCCQTIQQIKHDLIGLNAKELKQKYKNKPARETLQALNVIINRIITRENSYKINVLEAMIKDSKTDDAKAKPSYTVRLMIIDKKSGAGIPLEGTLIFDPAVNPVPYLNKIKDSSHILNANLLSNSNGLLIRFNEPENKPVIIAAPPPNNTTQKNAGRTADNTPVIMLVIGGLCLLAGLIAYIRSLLLLRKARATNSLAVAPAEGSDPASTNLQQAGNTSEKTQPAREESTGHLPGSESVPAAANPVDKQLLNTSMLPVAPTSKKHFFADIMTTSGPRKKYVSEPGADKDLGEDVCGFVSDDKNLLIYLLDGTSDLHCLRNSENNQEYFSSRLLAQSLANQLRLAFTGNRQEALENVMLQAIQTVKSDWLRIVGNLPAVEKNRIRASIENKSFPECATTLLIGRLAITGNITVYRSGDSKMLLFSSRGKDNLAFEDTPLFQKNEQSNDRVFFRLTLNAEKEFDILYNKPHYEIIEKENIHTAIIFSDGIGTLTEQLLQHRYSTNAEETRKDIFYQIQGTADDKSICFITIRQ